MCILLIVEETDTHTNILGSSSNSREFWMAVHCRFFVFVALLLLYFASTTVTGRSMREVCTMEGEERQKNLLMHKNKDKRMQGSDELVTMDYTPASKKPPIHN